MTMCAYGRLCVCTCMNLSRGTGVSMYMGAVCVHMCVCVHVLMCMPACMNVFVHMSLCMCVNVCEGKRKAVVYGV